MLRVSSDLRRSSSGFMAYPVIRGSIGFPIPSWRKSRFSGLGATFRRVRANTGLSAFRLEQTRLGSLVNGEDENVGVGALNCLVRRLHDSGPVSVLGEQVFNGDLSRLDFCDIDVAFD